MQFITDTLITLEGRLEPRFGLMLTSEVLRLNNDKVTTATLKQKRAAAICIKSLKKLNVG